MAAPRVRASLRTAGVVLLGAVLISGCSFAASSGSERAASSSSGSSSASHPSTAPSSASVSPSTGGAAVTSSSGGTSGGAPSSSGGPTATGRCHTGDLSAGLQPGSPGAGQRYATLVLTNRSGRTCTIHGYGGLGLTGADGAALPTQQVRVPDPPATTVTLAPGETASAQLHWGAVTSAGDAQTGPCQPTPAALHVIPPDETTSLSVPWTQGPVCDQGRIEQRAYAG